jgi:putative transposase
MSASHKIAQGTAARGLVGRGFMIVPEVGLVDREQVDHARLVERLAGRVGEELVTFAERMREGLLAASVGIGLDVLGELMAAEVSEVAGPRGRHNREGRAVYRHGGQDGAVVLGGGKVAVRRPRVRGVEGAEMHLAS